MNKSLSYGSKPYLIKHSCGPLIPVLFTSKVEDIEFAGIPVKLYTPTAIRTVPRPAIFYIHGGGWTLGSAGACTISNSRGHGL